MRAFVLLFSTSVLRAALMAQCTESEARFQKIVQRMVRAINDHEYAAARQDFAEVMRKALPENKAKVFFDNLLGEHGNIPKLGSVRYNPPNQAVIPILFEKGLHDGQDKRSSGER